MNLCIFVYGTLRRGCSSGAHQRFLGNAQWLGEGRVPGQLYRVSHYPALVPGNGRQWVVGELYRLPDSNALAALDDYEECSAGYPAPQEYRRELLDVALNDQTRMQAWGYYYNWPVAALSAIASGDFLHP